MKYNIKKTLSFILICAVLFTLSAFLSRAALRIFDSADTLFLPKNGFNDASQEAHADGTGDYIYRSFAPADEFNENLTKFELPSVQEESAAFTEYVPLKFLDFDSPDEYVGMQGSCTDGKYYYTAFLVKEHKTGNVLDAELICTYETTDIDGNIIFYKISLYDGLLRYLQHANGMTYNSVTDEVVITCCAPGYEQYVYVIPGYDLRHIVREPRLRRQTVSCKVNSLTYNETLNKYVAALCGTSTQFALLDSNFQVERTFGTKTPWVDDTWKIQGICSDDNYIYLVQYHSYDTISAYNKKHPENEISLYGLNKLRIFDWNGCCLKTVNLEFEKKVRRWIYEAESVVVNNDRLMVCLSCVHNEKNRSFEYVDLFDLAYHIRFCPDENVTDYIGENDGKNNGETVSGLYIKGISTELYENRIVNPGKTLVGWTAYRVEEGKWLYSSADKKGGSGWFTEGSQPKGYKKYIYSDRQRVSQTGTGGSHILMCARWQDTDSFCVSFNPNGGTGIMEDLYVVYDEPVPLPANIFEKTNRTFAGWYAYSPELNKWHYISLNGVKDGWYVEGLQPRGYVKWLYQNEQDVSDMVYPGSHVVMYAAWDEFTVYYNADGKSIKPLGIKDQMIAKCQPGKTNAATGYDPAYVSDGDSVEAYYLYRLDMDKWRYINNETGEGGWYKEGRQPDGFEKYTVKLTYDPDLFAYPNGVLRLGATVPAGEHLVLYAKWQKNSASAQE